MSEEIKSEAENGNGNGAVKLTRQDFITDQEVRWCPGCGDYSILAQVQKVTTRFLTFGAGQQMKLNFTCFNW